jgi:hypothetical protein
VSRLIRLYPRAWRARYEAEMLEVLAERPLTLGGRIDLVRAAVDAHLHPQLRWTGPAPIRALTADEARLLRNLGRATVAGVVLWIAGLLVAVEGPVVADEHGSYRDGTAAVPFLFLAGLLLAGGLFGHVVRLADAAGTGRLAAAVAAPVLVLYLLGPWMFPIGGLALGLLALHVLSAMRVGAWPLAAGVIVLVSASIAVGGLGLGLAIGVGDRVAASVWFFGAFLALAPIWLAVGGTLLDARASRSEPVPA